MCGIAGLLSPQPFDHGSKVVQSMLDRIAHRGPDDEGAWESSSGQCVLGHKRLSIIDLSSGHQPMASPDESVVITFNGCIYNYQQLSWELRARGHAFETHSDTEVILRAYLEWGERCVTHFNGMWAFALWDNRQKKLFCSRDRVGIKPFYYHFDSEGRFTFASEVKALLATPHVNAAVDQQALRQYLTFQF